MKPTVKPCDSCGAPVDADYATTELGVCLCDTCMIGDDPDPFATVLHERRGIRLDAINDVCNRADGVIDAQQVEHVRAAIGRARALFNRGERLAAMEAGQSALDKANGLFNALESQGDIQTGNKLRTKAAKGNAARSKKADNQHDEWQRRANAKWTEPQHANKSASAVARLIRKENENPDTIRRAIKHPQK